MAHERSDRESFTPGGQEPGQSRCDFEVACFGQSQVLSHSPLRLAIEQDAKWAYGALIAIDAPDGQPYLVKIRTSVLSGQAGFGVLNKAEDDFIYRTFVDAPPGAATHSTVYLPVDEPSQAGRLVVQAADSDVPTRLMVEEIQLLHQPRAADSRGGPNGGGLAVPIEIIFQDAVPVLRAHARDLDIEALRQRVTTGADAGAAAVLELLDDDRRARRKNAILSPARAALYRLRAELLVRAERGVEALAAAKVATALDPQNERMLETLHRGVAAVRAEQQPLGCVALLITCDARQDQCAPLRDRLIARGWPVRVISGAATVPRHAWEYLIVHAGDTYEDLTEKMRDAFVTIFETCGEGTAVLKMDDDLDVSDAATFTERWRALANDASIIYAGMVAPMLTVRDWHFNKCHNDAHNARPYGRQADWPYARGLCYYLSAAALRKYYEYIVRFPDEILGSGGYEDVFVGKVMQQQECPLHAVDLIDFGVAPTGLQVPHGSTA